MNSKYVCQLATPLSPSSLLLCHRYAPPSAELLAYYRGRIEDFETERQEFLKRFQEIHVLQAPTTASPCQTAHLTLTLAGTLPPPTGVP